MPGHACAAVHLLCAAKPTRCHAIFEQRSAATGTSALCFPHQGGRKTHTTGDMHALSSGRGTQHGINEHATGGCTSAAPVTPPRPPDLIIKLPGCVRDRAWCSRLNAAAFTGCWAPSRGWWASRPHQERRTAA